MDEILHQGWGGIPEAAAISHALRIRIPVFDCGTEEWWAACSKGAPLNFALCFDGVSHYDLLLRERFCLKERLRWPVSLVPSKDSAGTKEADLKLGGEHGCAITPHEGGPKQGFRCSGIAWRRARHFGEVAVQRDGALQDAVSQGRIRRTRSVGKYFQEREYQGGLLRAGGALEADQVLKVVTVSGTSIGNRWQNLVEIDAHVMLLQETWRTRRGQQHIDKQIAGTNWRMHWGDPEIRLRMSESMPTPQARRGSRSWCDRSCQPRGFGYRR